MDFELSAEQQALGEAVRHFIAKDYDFEARKRVLASPHGFSDSVWKNLAELGVLGVGPRSTGVWVVRWKSWS
jgi:alkylation response protein AidB-like acyl-CoA dehydrogenase